VSEAEHVSRSAERTERTAVVTPGQPLLAPVIDAGPSVLAFAAAKQKESPAAVTRQFLRLQRTRGNQFVQRVVAGEGAVQRQEEPPEPSRTVPGLPREVATQVEANLGGNRQTALDTLTKTLSDRRDIDLSFLTGEKMTSVSDATRMAPGHYGLTSLSPGTGRPRPCRVEIGPDAFRSLGDLYATVMHEWLHVLQFRRPAAASEAADELEARLWEVENLERTGLWRDARYMGRIRGDLNGWWARLTLQEQGSYQNRYDAARQQITAMTGRLEEEQFRQQRRGGVRRSPHVEDASPGRVGSLQRQDAFEMDSESEYEPVALDQELEQLFDSIRGTPVPAFEAITSTTGAERSRGELEDAVKRLWRRERLSFTSAARRVAREGSGIAADPRAAQSQPLAPDAPYAQRWTLNLLAADYQTGADVPEVADLLRRGSPFQQMLAAEFDHVMSVLNPTGNMMRSAIIDAIMELSRVVPQGQHGELAVTFSGHGSNGRIVGVDDGVLLPHDLQLLAGFAAEWDVHIIYVLDTCRAGQLVAFAQAAAIGDVSRRLGDLPAAARSGPQALMNLARRLGSHSATVNHQAVALGTAQRAYERRRSETNRTAVATAFTAFAPAISALNDDIREIAAGGAVPAEAATQFSELQVQVLTMHTYALATLATGPRNVTADLRQAAVVLDTMYDFVNRLIELANVASRQTAEPAAAGATE
jgi:hypothetical protein